MDTDGSIFLYQNGKKEFPRVYKNMKKVTMTDLIRFIKEHSTYPVNLPPEAHIPEDMLDEYWDEKS